MLFRSLVTGASKGIGRAIAIKFAEQGANVAFTYLSSVEQGQALETALASKGVKAKGYRSDAADFAQAEKLINDVVSEFGSLALSSGRYCTASPRPENMGLGPGFREPAANSLRRTSGNMPCFTQAIEK